MFKKYIKEIMSESEVIDRRDLTPLKDDICKLEEQVFELENVVKTLKDNLLIVSEFSQQTAILITEVKKELPELVAKEVSKWFAVRNHLSKDATQKIAKPRRKKEGN